MHYEKLFEPYSIGNMHLKNRVVMGPMATQFTDNHMPNDRVVAHYAARAKGGAGLFLTEHTVTQLAGNYGERTLFAFPESCVPYWKKLFDAVHYYGSKMVVQLGNIGNSCSNDFNEGHHTVSASAIPEPMYETVPHEITIEQIEEFKKDYLSCVKNMYNAGADGVMLHLTNGYFIASFLSGRTNKRTDKYGGSLEGRLRLPLELIRMIREEVGAHFPIFARLAAYEPNGGRAVEESKVIARVLQDAGVQALSINCGSFFEIDYEIPTYYREPGFAMRAVEEIKRSVRIPIMAGGRINEPRMAEQILQEGRVDLIEINRGYLTDANWVVKAQAGKIDTIRRCIGCTRCVNDECTADRHYGGTISCSVNPFLGMDEEFAIIPADTSKRVLVVGGGPGGLQAAVIAALRGHKVVLAEKDHTLGGMIRVAAVPPMKYEIASLITTLTCEAKNAGVKILLDTAVDAEYIKREKPDVVIVATGATPVVPNIPGISEQNVHTAIEVLAGKVWPGQKIAVIGGSMIGCETADYLSEYGKNITVFEMTDTIGADLYHAVRVSLIPKLKRSGVILYPSATVMSIKDGVITYEKNGETILTEQFDDIFIAVGMKSNNLLANKLKEEGINPIVIGDAVSPTRLSEVLVSAVEATIKL